MPPRNPRHKNSKTKRKPYQGKARKESRIPLDPAFLVQRPLLSGNYGSHPIATLKSTTKHPTVFRKRIAKVDSSAKHGDVVKVVADNGEIIGYGVWNPRAEATIRILSWGDTLPDVHWWSKTLSNAVDLRKNLLKLPQSTEAYRVINAEGDGLPGLVVDVYKDIISVQTYTLAMYQRAEAIAKELARLMDLPHWVVRTGPKSFDQEGFVAEGFESGNVPSSIRIKEGNALFEIHPFEGHKTGYFCDQRENRQRLAQFCNGKDVLDLCCYSGGFAVNAGLGGAKRITAVDLDEEAIEIAKRNANINKVKAKFLHVDAFIYMREMQKNKKKFDVIILDPPKLIRSRDESHDGQNKYFDLNQLASSIIKPGGLLLTCSCSGLLSMNDFTMTVRAATADASPRLLFRTGAGGDHPVNMNCLESEYLKCLWMQVGVES